jgi:hypothetical protein
LSNTLPKNVPLPEANGSGALFNTSSQPVVFAGIVFRSADKVGAVFGSPATLRNLARRRLKGVRDGGRLTMAFAGAARAAIAALFTFLPASIGLAQTVADFYRGKSIDLYISSGVGGGNDLYARVVARHIGKHIPGNPTVLPKNMEGAGGMRLANWLYNVGARDGTVIGAVSRAMAFEPLLGNKTAQYDASKFNYIGSANDQAHAFRLRFFCVSPCADNISDHMVSAPSGGWLCA